MIATLTSKGQITIPLSLRTRLNLKAGDQLEFDESAPVLTARRVIHRGEWEKVFGEWQNAAEIELRDHPWEKQPSAAIINDLRDGLEETGAESP